MQCTTCGEPAAYSRRYSGESLCSPCFCRSISRRAALAISRHSMIRRGDRVCVGVSGGKDSLALLDVLHAMSERGGFELLPVTIDEGIAGYRDEALAIVSRFCSSLGLHHTVVSYAELFGTTLDDALASRGGARESSCSMCGTLRRRALDVAAGRLRADSVATAHNLDDIVQTMLINLSSGDASRIGRSDPDAQGGPAPRRIKPFCDTYEAEIAFYAFARRLPFQEEACPHAGEGIRTEMREFLNALEARHSGIKNNLYRSAVELSRAVRSSAEPRRASECASCGAPSAGRTCSACLALERIRRRAQRKPNANIDPPRTPAR